MEHLCIIRSFISFIIRTTIIIYHIYSFLSKLMNLTIKTKSFFNILV